MLSMSLHVVTRGPESGVLASRSSHWVPEFSRRRKHFSPAPCSLAYHFGANLKIVDMHARQATSRGVNRGHTRVGKSNWIEESPSSRTCHVCICVRICLGHGKLAPLPCKVLSDVFRRHETSTLLVAPPK